MRAIDRQLAGYGKLQVRFTAAKFRLLECNQSGALWIVAPDRQIPVGRRREVIDRQLGAFRVMHSAFLVFNLIKIFEEWRLLDDLAVVVDQVERRVGSNFFKDTAAQKQRLA